MNRTDRTAACTLAAVCASRAHCAAAPRMDSSKLLIGAYCLQANARTEAHVKAIRDCSVDFIAGVGVDDRATLDLFAKHRHLGSSLNFQHLKSLAKNSFKKMFETY